jgi:hypothetical protein
VGLWITFHRSPILAEVLHGIRALFFAMVPGCAFLTSIVLIELFRAMFPGRRSGFHEKSEQLSMLIGFSMDGMASS